MRRYDGSTISETTTTIRYLAVLMQAVGRGGRIRGRATWLLRSCDVLSRLVTICLKLPLQSIVYKILGRRIRALEFLTRGYLREMSNSPHIESVGGLSG